MSRITSAMPIISTPLGAITSGPIRPGATGSRHGPRSTHTVPTLPTIQLAIGTQATNASRKPAPSIRRCRVVAVMLSLISGA